MCIQREHIHDQLDDLTLLQHVEELGVSGAAIVASRQSRYLLPHEIIVGDHDARVRAHFPKTPPPHMLESSLRASSRPLYS